MKALWLRYLILFLLAVNIALMATLLIRNIRNQPEKKVIRKEVIKRMHPGGPEDFEAHLQKELGLNEEQSQKIRQMSQEFHQDKKSDRERMHNLRRQYFDELAQANPDTAKLANLSNQIGEMESAKIRNEYIHYRNIRSVCSDEQAKKLDSLGRMHMQHRYRHSFSDSPDNQKNSR